MLTRRKIRRGGGGGRNAGGSAHFFGNVPRLPANTIEWWHSELGIVTVANEVDTWAGQKAGLTLTASSATQRPTYAADGSNFRGRPVVQCEIAVNRGMLGTFAPFTSAGSRPWAFLVWRERTLQTVNPEYFVSFGAGGFGQGFFPAWHPGGGNNWAFTSNNNDPVAIFNPHNTNQHRTEVGYDPGNADKFYYSMDGAARIFAAASTVVANACTTLAVGRRHDADSARADSSHAFIVIASSKPTDLEIATLNSDAQAIWG
jgi:hypothetical protein